MNDLNEKPQSKENQLAIITENELAQIEIDNEVAGILIPFNSSLTTSILQFIKNELLEGKSMRNISKQLGLSKTRVRNWGIIGNYLMSATFNRWQLQGFTKKAQNVMGSLMSDKDSNIKFKSASYVLDHLDNPEWQGNTQKPESNKIIFGFNIQGNMSIGTNTPLDTSERVLDPSQPQK